MASLTISVHLILMLIALICFVLEAFFHVAKVNLIAVGLAFLAAGLMFTGTATAS